MKKKLATLLMICCAVPLLSLSQPYYFKHYQVENGLSYSSVFNILQDSRGFMWFGTRDGLNRFDGYTFKVYRHIAGDATSLGSDCINSLFEDDLKNIWVGTDLGLYIYHLETEQFTLFKNTEDKQVYGVTKDSKNNLWMIVNNELCRFDIKARTFHLYKNKDSSKPTAICENNSGELWVSYNDGRLRRYRYKEDTFSSSYDLFSHSEGASSHFIQTIEKVKKDLLFIGTTNQGVKVFNCQSKTYKDVLTYNENRTTIYVRDFLKNTDDEYWIATESGIYIYNVNTGIYQHLKKQIDNPYSLSDNAVYDLFKDHEGSIWAGTYFGGVNYYPKIFSNFKKYFPDLSKNSLVGNAVREICKDKYNNLWIGTEDGGLNRYEIASGKFQHFLPTGQKGSISYTNIHGLLADGDKLWVGTFEHGLDVMDIPTKKVIRHYAAGNSSHDLKSNFIVTFLKTRMGKIMIGTSNGLYEYNPGSDNFNPIHLDNRIPFVYSLIEDNQGNIWATTINNGVFRYNPTTGRSTHFVLNTKANSLSNNSVTSVFQDSDQMIWFATYGGGLNRYNPKTNHFTTFNTQDGLSSNIIFKVLEDKQKNLWITTSKGLIVKRHISKRFEIYTTANGLLSDQFNYNSGFIDEQGTLYFGSLKGMISFNPTSFKSNNVSPPLYFTGFQINNKDVTINENGPLKKSILFADHIELSYKQSSFSINFAALSYAAPEMTEYAYQMEGLSKEWTYLQTNRTVYFTELAPGDYTFRVRVSNRRYQNLPTERTLHFTVLSPVWTRWWAYSIYLILVGMAVYFVLMYFLLREKEEHNRITAFLENEKEKEIYEAKIAFFTYIAHEIRTPLTLIKGPMENIIKKAAAIPEIQHNLQVMDKNTERLLNLTNQLLDLRKAEANSYKLNFIKINISKVLNDMFIRFQPAAEKKNINFQIILPKDAVFAYVDLEAFQKITSNLFDNAIKYAESRAIIKLNPTSLKDVSFKLNITNDGYLIPENLKEKIFDPFFRIKENEKSTGTGIGLHLTKFLTELHGGSIIVINAIENLNDFELTLPVHQGQEINMDDEVSHIGYDQSIVKMDDVISKTCILIVDDHEEILDFLSNELEENFHILKATNGKKALNILDLETVHLVISDIMMPEMDGYELCSAIKNNLHYSHIPIILLTAKSTLESKIEGLETGADAYIEKPFSPEHLKAQIANLFENREKIREYFAKSPLVHIKTLAYNKSEEDFLGKLQQTILDNLDKSELDVELLAAEMNMSRPTLYRKIKSISDLTPNELINITRLKKAAELLVNSNFKIYEISEMVGYSSQTHFGRNFHKQFGMSPSEYTKSKKDNKEVKNNNTPLNNEITI